VCNAHNFDTYFPIALIYPLKCIEHKRHDNPTCDLEIELCLNVLPKRNYNFPIIPPDIIHLICKSTAFQFIVKYLHEQDGFCMMASSPFNCSWPWNSNSCFATQYLNNEILKLLYKEKVTLECIESIIQGFKKLDPSTLRCTKEGNNILVKIQTLLIQKNIIN